MDAHILRRIGLELKAHLNGARIITIYRPAQPIYAFKISKPALRPYLIFQYGSRAASLFLSKNKPVAPFTPDTPTMRMRKYLSGRKINGIWLDWHKRCLCLGIAKRKQSEKEQNITDNQAEFFLLMDIKNGPYFAGCLPEDAEDLCTPNRQIWDINSATKSLDWASDNLNQPWQDFPYLTPSLRKTLKSMPDEGDQLALLADLETANGDTFMYLPSNSQTNQAPFLSAWPLPLELKGAYSEHIFSSALEAWEQYGESHTFDQANIEKGKSKLQELSREKKRLTRALAKIAQEEKKLLSMQALKQEALLLQNNLFQFAPDQKLLELELPLTPEDEKTLKINLQSELTVRENMALMFKKAAKGLRGLPHLSRRKAEIEARLKEISQLGPNTIVNFSTRPKKKTTSAIKEETNPLISKFISPSGLVLLRGRNARGNREALKLASPFDLWLHAEGGPSAHLIIRLPHAAYSPTEEDLREAARLVAEKSWQRDDKNARIMCAKAKDVHPIKGAPHGTVRVDKIIRVLVVET